MKYVKIILSVIISTGIFYPSTTFMQAETMYYRLMFEGDSLDSSASATDTSKYLWERQLVAGDQYWIQQRSDSGEWSFMLELPPKIKVGLVLAGGGDRGIAHIGVLKALEENNIPLHAIVGNSMGAIVGGFYACGYSVDSLISIVQDSIQWRIIFSDQPPRQYLPIWERLREKPCEPGLNWNMEWYIKWWPPKAWIPSSVTFKPGAGLRTAQKFTDEIVKRTLAADYHAGFVFDSLPIPFGAVLTNMTTRKSNLKKTGTVSAAVRGSGSLPLIFEPMEIDNVEYVDGMVMDNLPVDGFRPFDEHRAVDKRMFIDGDTANFIIAVDPIKKKGVRDQIEIKPELSGSMGIGVMNQTSTMARDFYIWESWDTADAWIDIDVEGNFDFSIDQLKDKIRKGYDTAWKEMYWIKKEIAEKEIALDRDIHVQNHDHLIHRIRSIKLKYIEKEDTSDVTEIGEHKRILNAIKVHEGCYIEKVDIGDILTRIYELGDFSYVEAKTEDVRKGLILTFYLSKKQQIIDVKRFLKISKCDLSGVANGDTATERLVGETICRRISKKGRPLEFNETKNIVEKALVEEGYIAPKVSNVTFTPISEYSGNLDIHVETKGRLSGVLVNDVGLDTVQPTSLTERISDFFRENATPFGPKKIFITLENAQRRFNLKTIAVQGVNGSSLVVDVEKKPSHTLELPALALEDIEGISLFVEARCREWSVPFARDWLCWSTYFNYTQNFVLKRAQELPQGQKVGMGMQRCNYKILVPEWSAYWQKLRYPSGVDTLSYDMQFKEFQGYASLPIYLLWQDLFAFIPGITARKTTTYLIGDDSSWQRWQYTLEGRVRLDRLDRIIFPESGFLVDLTASMADEPSRWWRTKIKGLCIPFSYKIQKQTMSVFTLRGYASYFVNATPLNFRYSMGGLTPIGSYQLRRFDSEDLSGYDRNEFMESVMWKIGGSYRIALIEMSPLDLRFNLYLVASYDLASAAPSIKESFYKQNLKHCPTVGFQIDMSYFNIGLIFVGKQERFMDNFHLSLVYYGLGI